VLLDGVLQQVASPRELYESPANVFVAGFIGSPAMSLISSSVADGSAVVAGYQIPIERSIMNKLNNAKSVMVGMRPEDLTVNAEGIPMEIDLVEELGADAYLYGKTPSSAGTPVSLIVRVPGDTKLTRGSKVKVKPTRTYLFEDSPTGKRLT
jgi:multiple sugar transport system ATP-binding protein